MINYLHFFPIFVKFLQNFSMFSNVVFSYFWPISICIFSTFFVIFDNFFTFFVYFVNHFSNFLLFFRYFHTIFNILYKFLTNFQSLLTIFFHIFVQFSVMPKFLQEFSSNFLSIFYPILDEFWHFFSFNSGQFSLFLFFNIFSDLWSIFYTFLPIFTKFSMI